MSKRRKITCIKCGAEQSTYSSNRVKCHKCEPKCTERHTFTQLAERKAAEKRKQERAG